MNSNQNLNKGTNPTSNFVGSRAYTFVDSYIYMKNKNYNALYEKNKEILLLENDAIKHNSPKLLYTTFFEQMKILDSVVTRMRDFSFRIKDDVVSNINLIMPDNGMIEDFESAINKVSLLPRFKYLRYKIKSTNYTDMAVFFNMFKNEIKEFCEIKDSTSNVSKPLLHSKATNYLTKIAVKYTNYSDSILECEEIKIVTIQRLIDILTFFQRKAQLKQMINDDFKTYWFYLKQYKVLYSMTLLLEPTIIGNDIEINLGGSKHRLTFNDYLVLYKHFSAMTKYLLDIVNYYNNKFFNKFYAIQSNIQVYKNIMSDVIAYANNIDIDNLNESSDSFNDLYGMINGNDAAMQFLSDDVNDYEQVLDDDNDEPYKPDTIISDENELDKELNTGGDN